MSDLLPTTLISLYRFTSNDTISRLQSKAASSRKNYRTNYRTNVIFLTCTVHKGIEIGRNMNMLTGGNVIPSNPIQARPVVLSSILKTISIPPTIDTFALSPKVPQAR
jgi:hypothetical protein